MALDRLAFALSLVAVGLGGFALYAQGTAARDARSRADADATIEARLATLEAAAKTAADARAPALAAAPGTRTRPAGTTSTPDAGGASGAPGSPAAAAPLTVEQRVAELEKQWKATLEGGGGAVPAQTVSEPVALENTWFGDLDGAAKAFELSAPQKAEWERSIADAKRALDELRKVPDETGKTWEQVMKDAVSVVDGEVSYDGSHVQAFREKVIPGRNESFGAADRRLRADAKKRMRDTLPREQQDRFDKAHVDGLLPGGNGDGGGLTSIFSAFGGAINVTVPAPAATPDPAAPEAGK